VVSVVATALIWKSAVAGVSPVIVTAWVVGAKPIRCARSW
jgi:hypothetical protein